MIQVKHLLEKAGQEDGQRLWIEPIGLTLDLQEWCHVDHLLCHLGPPRKLWDWYENHPDGYDYFRAKYHEALSAGPYRQALIELVAAARRETFTLIHQGDDQTHNSATAFHEFLCELEAYVPPQS
jgi:uncharacterized protein YeaO (DUF488 family)